MRKSAMDSRTLEACTNEVFKTIADELSSLRLSK